MQDYELKELHKKIDNVLEKYKEKPRVSKKMRDISKRFMGFDYTYPPTYKELAKLTAKINYRCGFKDGRCKGGRSSEMCCCNNCGGSLGHIHERFFSHRDREDFIEEELLYYTQKFSTKTGFWRKDKGCILPRERRSSTCLIYNCTSKLTKYEHLLIDVIRDNRHMPSYIHRIIDVLKDYFLYRVD